MRSFLFRIGGLVVRPRTTLRALSPGEGASDGLALLALYAVGAKLEPLARGAASFQASAGVSAVLGLSLAVVAFLPWVLAGLAVELALGRARAERSELIKVPLLLAACAAVLLDHAGAPIPGPDFVPEALGAAASVALALWVRPALPVAEGAVTPASTTLQRRAVAVGALVLAGAAAAAVADGRMVAERWSTMAPVGVGEVSPSFRAPLLDGGAVSADDLAAAPHLFVFWTTWCGVCEQEMPTIAAIERRFAERGLRVIAVNADAGGDHERRALVDAYRRGHTMPGAIALDAGSMRSAFRVRVYPHLVLVDRAGRIRNMHQGRVFEGTLASEIEAVLGEGG